jgi:hypothetical protein
MKSYIQAVSPGDPWFAHIEGNTFLLSVATGPVDIYFLREGRVVGHKIGAVQGYKAKPEGGFEAFRVTSASVQQITVDIAKGDVDETNSPTAIAEAIDTLLRATPLDVSNDRGTPGNLMHVTGVSLADAPATAINNLPTVACGPVAVLIKPANVDCRKARFVNLGPDPVAIGGAGITWATRSLVLEAGDTWPEDIAGNLAWYGITDAGDAATVGVQEIEQ